MSQFSMICRTFTGVVLLALAIAAPREARALADSAVHDGPRPALLPNTPTPSVAFGCQDCFNPYPYEYDGEGNVYGYAGEPCIDSSGLVPPLYCAHCDFGDCSGYGYYTLPCNEALCVASHEEDMKLLTFAVDENDVGLIAELVLSRRAFLSTEDNVSTVRANKCDGSVGVSHELHLEVAERVLAAIAEAERHTQ